MTATYSNDPVSRARTQQMGDVNRAAETRGVVEAQIAAGSAVDPELAAYASAYSFLTDDTITTLRYYYGKGVSTRDFSDFNAYYKLLAPSLYEAKYQAELGCTEVLADEEGPWGEIAAGINSVINAWAAPVAYFDTRPRLYLEGGWTRDPKHS